MMKAPRARASPTPCVDEMGDGDVFSGPQMSLLLSQIMQDRRAEPSPQSSGAAAVDTTRRSRHFSGVSHNEAPPTESAEVRDTSSDDSVRSGARGKLRPDRDAPVLFSGAPCCVHTGSDSATGAGPITPASSSAVTSGGAPDFTLVEQLTAARAHADGLSLARDGALLDALNYGAAEEARQRSAEWFGVRASTVMPPLQSAVASAQGPITRPAALGSLSALLDEARGHYERSQRARRMVECASHAAASTSAAPSGTPTGVAGPSASASAAELPTLRALVTTLQARCSMAAQDAARAAATTAFLRERLELLLDAAAAAWAPDVSASAQSAAVAALRDLTAATRTQLGADSGRRLRDELRAQMAATERALAETQRATAAAAAREDELRAQLLQERAERRRADAAVMTSEATMDRIRRSRQAARDECERQRQQCEALRRELGRVRAASLAKTDEGASPRLRLTVGASPTMCDSLSTVSPTTTVVAHGGAAFPPVGPVTSPSVVPSAALSTSDVSSVHPSPVGPSTAVHPNTTAYQVASSAGQPQALARFVAVQGACDAPALAADPSQEPQRPFACAIIPVSTASAATCAPAAVTRTDRGSVPRNASLPSADAGPRAPRAPSACEDEVQATVVVDTPVVRRDRAVDPGKFMSIHASTVSSLSVPPPAVPTHSSPISDVRGESPNRLSRSLTSHAGAAFARSNTSLGTSRRFGITAIAHAAEPTQGEQHREQQRVHADPHSPQAAPRDHGSPTLAAAGGRAPPRQSFFAEPALHGRNQSSAAVTTAPRRFGAATTCAAAPRIDASTAFRRSETTPLCAIGSAPVYRASPLAATTSGVSPFATVHMPQRRLSTTVVAARAFK